MGWQELIVFLPSPTSYLVIYLLATKSVTFMNIGIIGLGLIGGSLGLDLRSHAHYVWGVSRSDETCKQAVAIGAVDAASLEVSVIPYLKQTDVVFICTPIAAILPTIKAIAPYLLPTTIITDVGSVKQAIVAEAETLHSRFVGGHPMAGTAFNGINAAERNLFKERPCVLTHSDDTDAIATVRSLWESIGAVVHTCDPVSHDRAVAWISHLPVMVSASLILACQGEEDVAIAMLAQKLASSGFRDTSRVGGGNPELGRLMAETNQTALLKTLHEYQQTLQGLIAKIEAGEWQDLERSLKLSQSLRNFYVINS